MAEHISWPGGEFREGLQPFMPLAVTVWNYRPGESGHWLQPRGEIIGDGHDAPLAGFRLSSRNFDECLLDRQMHILPIERRELASAEPGEEADCSGGE